MTRRQAVKIVKPPVTWILVADSQQAQVYTRQKVEKVKPLRGNSLRNQFEEIVTLEPVAVNDMHWESEGSEPYEVGRNATAMVFESVGSARHMDEPHMDAREKVASLFAKMVAEQMNQARAEKRFDRLVLVAPAKILGEMKKHLDKKVLAGIVAEMPKDLTQYNGLSLAEHLEGMA